MSGILGYNPTGRGASWMYPDGGSFPNPWEDVASLWMPESMPVALRMCEYIAVNDGLVNQALNRVLSYFVTDSEIDDVSDDEIEKWKEYLNEKLDIRHWLRVIGYNALVYGNSFVSVLPGLRKYLACARCRRVEHPFKVIAENPRFQFRFADWKFHATCPGCGYRGPWKVYDRKVGEKESVVLKLWNPHDIELLWTPYRDECRVIWKIPEDHRRLIREGKIHVLEETPSEVIDACAANRYILLDKDFVYHMKEDTLCGVRNRGWGISRLLSNFRQNFYVQVLRRYNEAIALDYVIPFRLLTPAPGDKQAGTDPLTNSNMGSTVAQMRSMLRRRRHDPAAWNILPFAVQYQALGGEAKQMAPVDLINQGVELQLSCMGIPADLWKGSLQVQSAPVALRLFETSWSALPHRLNGVLRFIVSRIAQILSWEAPKAKLARITHADDIATQQAQLQLMMGGQISPQTGLKSVHLDAREEEKRKIDFERFRAELQAKAQKEMEGSAQMEQMVQEVAQGGAAGGGAPGAPGAPGGQGAPQSGQPAPGGQQPAGPMGAAQQSVAASLAINDNEPITPNEIWQRADTAAKQLLGMDPQSRESELRKLKQINPSIHPYVTARVEALRQEASKQGRDAVLQQQFGQS